MVRIVSKILCDSLLSCEERMTGTHRMRRKKPSDCPATATEPPELAGCNASVQVGILAHSFSR